VTPADIVCQNCGWQNEPTARMCGGCGRPLRESDPGATAFVGGAGIGLASPAENGATLAHDAPTLAGLETALDAPPLKVAWPGVAASRGKRAHADGAAAPSETPWWRIPLIVGAVLAVLVIALLGTWALGIRPAIHTSLDTQMRTVLDSGVYAAFTPSSALSSGTYNISASSLNSLVATQLSAGSPVSNVTIAFAHNQVIVTYAFWGSSGQVVSSLGVQNSRAVATGTSVDCPLCLVESGDEMEATFNDALSKIPSTVQVTNIATINDVLKVTVKTGS
jgi:hypothetical protein